MKDFSKAIVRPWEPNDDYTGVLYTHGNMKFHVCIMGSGGSTTQTREQEINNVELIVTAVNNFDKMKEFITEYNSFINELQSDGFTQMSTSDTRYFKKKAEQLLESLK